MPDVADFPGVERHLDTSEAYANDFEEMAGPAGRFLRVTQRGEFDGGQLSFRWAGDRWELMASDTVVEGLDPVAAKVPRKRACARSPDNEHQFVFGFAINQVDAFSTKSGPDGGNLACVWAVRHPVHLTLGRWVTRSDGTADFAKELSLCFGGGFREEDVPAGGIVISPTETLKDGSRNVGHVGILGRRGGGMAREVFSNSSARARWEQNFTLGTWFARYKDKKGLPVLFYPLPVYG
jgi:hypothetical protein